MKSRIIGLCVTNFRTEDSLLCFDSINKCAAGAGYSVVTFEPWIDLIDKAECENADSIYMINFSLLDSLIIDARYIHNEDFLSSCISRANEANINVYVIRGDAETPSGSRDNWNKLAIKLVDKIVNADKGGETAFIDADIFLKELKDGAELQEYNAEYVRDIKAFRSKLDELDVKLYMLSDRLMGASKIGEISEIIENWLIEDSLLCVHDSFMQDIFGEAVNDLTPKKEDKFFIVADSRSKKSTWKSFYLEEMCYNFEKMLASGLEMMIIPVYFRHQSYGYLITASDNCYLLASVIERYAMRLGEILGRYVDEKKLSFANSKLFQVNENIKNLKNVDMLTGMKTFNGFMEALEQQRKYYIDNKEKMLLVCIDLDRLGDINDIYGHSEGDIAISTLADIIKESVDEELCGHLGSDEFVVVLHGVNEEATVDSFSQVLSRKIDNYNRMSSKDYSLTINQSYLASDITEDSDLKSILEEALSRKRLAKTGRRRYSREDIDKEEEEFDEEENKMINDIISANRFKYAFQPIVDARTGDIYAYEALMRTDTEQFISPLVVLKHASRDNRLYEIEYATYFNVLEYISNNKEQLGKRKVFINSIPGYLLDDTDYSKLKHKYKDVFTRLVTEITEQNEIDDDSIAIIKDRSAQDDYKVAIDDFGTGYSNTTNLLRFLPNYVKIDRMLITEVQNDAKKQHFVKNIIEFSHANGLKALAEGVETKEELTAVIQMGVDLIQGFYTAKPGFELLGDITGEIKADIVTSNLDCKLTTKKMYNTSSGEQVLVVPLALDKYTGINVAGTGVTVVGNMDYAAEIQIKILDNTRCKLRLRDLVISQPDSKPCIELGKNCNVELILEGDNCFSGCGIRVPESSKVRIQGPGNLKILGRNSNNFGIGGSWETSFGDIEINMLGALDISEEGTRCIGIGGGKYAGMEGIMIYGGRMFIENTGTYAIGIGSVFEKVPISMLTCNVTATLNGDVAIGIGVFNGEQKVDIAKARVELNCKGDNACCIGSIEGQYGEFNVTSGHVICNISGGNIYAMGNAGSGASIKIDRAKAEVIAKGDSVVCFGSIGNRTAVDVCHSLVSIKAVGDDIVKYGTNEDSLKVMEGVIREKINGEKIC